MNIDAERYQLCLQCVLEDGSYTEEPLLGWGSSHAVMETFRLRIIDQIQKSIKSGWKWKNLLVTDFDDSKSDDPVCCDCPYILEHLVLTNKVCVLAQARHLKK